MYVLLAARLAGCCNWKFVVKIYCASGTYKRAGRTHRSAAALCFNCTLKSRCKCTLEPCKCTLPPLALREISAARVSAGRRPEGKTSRVLAPPCQPAIDSIRQRLTAPPVLCSSTAPPPFPWETLHPPDRCVSAPLAWLARAPTLAHLKMYKIARGAEACSGRAAGAEPRCRARATHR